MRAEQVVERVRRRLVDAGATPSPARVAVALRDEGVVLGDAEVLDLVGLLRDEMIGLGPLQPLLVDPRVTDVAINPPGEVWVDRGRGMERAGIRALDEESVRRLAQRLAGSAGRRLDEAAPYVDARLPDGSRLHAVIPPIAPEGTLVSLRIARQRAFTLDELAHVGTVGAQGSRWLRAIVRARLAFLVTGGTGSGKTTILAALLGSTDPAERILLVEDSSELRPAHPHVVRLEARPANSEGAGAVTLRDLVRQALRMRPDRVVVGEVRGPEVVDLLAALNTGHEGGCGTVHANSAQDVPARLEALGLTAGLPRDAVHALVGAGLDAVIHLHRSAEPVGRRVVGVFLLRRGHEGRVEAIPALLRRDDDLHPAEGFEELADAVQRRGVDVSELR